MLLKWAEIICVVAEDKIKDRIPQEFDSKIIWFNVGKDIWCNPYNKDLHKILMKMIDKNRDKLYL